MAIAAFDELLRRKWLVTRTTLGRIMLRRKFSQGLSPMSRIDYRNIEKDPARCGGQAVVTGTRIRVATILTAYRQGMPVEEIVQQYTGLKPADVHDAIAYAYDHLDEIEANLAADDESSVKKRHTRNPSP